MLQINNLSLVRTSREYKSTSIRDMILNSLQAPVSFFTQRSLTEYFLQNIDLKVSDGDKIALIGRNGSGKSTLCRIIAQQLFPSSGSIWVNGKVSLFSQIENSFFSDLTGRENLSFFINFIYSSLNEAERHKTLLDCIQFSELEKTIDRPLYTYSLGMISRLSLSLMTAHPHDILVLDEVHNHADRNFRALFSERLEKTIHSSKSFILVSHYEEDLLANCNRGVVLDKGKVLYDGNLKKALAYYKLFSGTENA